MTPDEEYVADLAVLFASYERTNGVRPNRVTIPLGRRHRLTIAIRKYGPAHGLDPRAIRIVRPLGERRR